MVKATGIAGKGQGWHRQSVRHSNARKTGVAGGAYVSLSSKIGEKRPSKSISEMTPKEFRSYKKSVRMTIRHHLKDHTIANLQDKGLELVQSDYEVSQIKELYGGQAEGYDGFLVKEKNGEYTEVWGFEGNVPELDKVAYKVV